MAAVDRAVTIADLRAIARRRLPEFAFVPMETGSGDGAGPPRNIAAFREHLLTAHALIDVTRIDQRATILGRSYASPFGISAVGHAGMLRRNADQMLAAASAAADVPFMLSGASTAPVEEIARIAPDHVWQQIYVARDPALTERIVGRARDAGVTVLVHTADSPVPPRNDWLARSGIRLPAHVPWRKWPYVAWQALTHPGWSLDHARRGGLPRLESWAPHAPPGSGPTAIMRLFQQQVPAGETWREVERLRRLWPGKLVIKGLVAPADAAQAYALGADAVIVSNHGGNKLDRMAASLDTLPRVRAGVAPGESLFFDGGVRKGADIVTAIALGADFCFVGRATLYGVIAGGEEGAARAIAILREEIDRTLALIGCPALAGLGQHFLQRHAQ